MKDLIAKLVLPNAKAIVAFLVASVATWLQTKGVVFEPDTVDALTSGVVGLVTALLVWFVPNKG
jgi:hypothetical protein